MTVIDRNENENQGSASVDDVDLENNVVDTSLSSSFPHNNNSGDDHHQEPSELPRHGPDFHSVLQALAPAPHAERSNVLGIDRVRVT